MSKKNRGVVVASLNKWPLIIYAFFVSSFVYAQNKEAAKWLKQESATSEVNSPHESWRRDLFGKDANKLGCTIVSRGLTFDAVKDPKLANIVRQIRSSVAEANWRTLLPLFHPRLKVTRKTLENLFASYEGTYGGKEFDTTPYRLWALNSPEGKAELIECKDDQLSLRGFYGYPLQMAVLLQISGRFEMGHAYVALVPRGKDWFIGAWHKIQWTHNGKDPESWINEAIVEHKKGNTKAAFVKIDLAYKLLDGGAFIYRQLRKDAEATRNSWLSYAEYTKMFTDKFPKIKIAHVGTALAADGAGILMRIVVDHNEAGNKLRENCRLIGQEIYKWKWTQPLGGFKCQMTTKFERQDREGVLGGYFFDAEDLRKNES